MLQRNFQGYTGSPAILGFHLHPSAQVMQALPDAKQAEAASAFGARVIGRVDPDAVILHLDINPFALSQNGDAGMLGLGMFDNIHEQLPHRPEEQYFNLVIHENGVHPLLDFHLDAVLGPHMFGEPFHGRFKPQLIKNGEAQFKGQGSGIFDHILDEFPHFAQLVGNGVGTHRFLQDPQLDLGDGQGLADVIVQIRGQLPPFPLFREG